MLSWQDLPNMHEILKKITRQRINRYCSQGLAIRVGLQNPTVAAVREIEKKHRLQILLDYLFALVRLGFNTSSFTPLALIYKRSKSECVLAVCVVVFIATSRSQNVLF